MVNVTDWVLAQALFGRPLNSPDGGSGRIDKNQVQNPISGLAVESASNAMRGAALANALDSYVVDTDGMAPETEARSAPADSLPNTGWSDTLGRDMKYGDSVSPMIAGPQVGQETLEQRRVPYLPPPSRPQRPFSADYPLSSFLDPRYLWYPPTDFQGRLRYDPERRGLEARHVAGRRYASQPDVGLQHHEVMDVLKQLGHAPRFLPTSQMPRPDSKSEPQVGGTGIVENTWPWSSLEGRFRPGQVSIDNSLDPRSEHIATGHELGHVLRLLSGLSLNDDARKEMRALFNTMNNHSRTPDGLNAAPGNVVTPETFGYPTQSPFKGLNSVEEEYLAEAFRAYMTDPNFVKSEAPNLAAAIRDAVNSNPRFRRVIQFNSLKFPTYA